MPSHLPIFKRIHNLEETYGMFSLYLSSENYGFRYRNRNYYCYHTDDPWNVADYTDDTWPKGYMIHFSPVSAFDPYTNAVILNACMKWGEMRPWIIQLQVTGVKVMRIQAEKAEKLLFLLKKDFPDSVVR